MDFTLQLVTKIFKNHSDDKFMMSCEHDNEFKRSNLD